MKRWLLGALAAGIPLGVAADEPSAPAKDDACLILNNRVIGPRTADRPLPLLAGDPAHGFRPACSVPWSTLSPKNQALAVVGCFRGSLLQVANDAACGRGTGPLWVSSRWVVTSAEQQQQQPQKQVAVCQQLETHAWAGTRDFPSGCEARKTKDLQPESEPQHPAESQPAPAAGSTPHPSR
jgi:hypothetical protein